MPWILERAKRYDEAIAAYTALLARFDGEPPAKLREILGQAQTALDRLDWDAFAAAAVAANRVDNRPPEGREVLRDVRSALSGLCVLKHRLPQAEEWLQEVLDEFPDDIGADNDLGYLWADQGVHLDRAWQMIGRAVAAEPDNAAYRDSLGSICIASGVPGSGRRAGEGDGQGAGGRRAGAPGRCPAQGRPGREGRRRLAAHAAAAFRKDKEEERPSPWRRNPGKTLTQRIPIRLIQERETHVRPFSLVHDQTQEGGRRRQAGQGLERARQGHHRGRQTRRRRRRHEPPPPLRHRQRQGDGHAQGQYPRAIKHGTGELDGGNLDEVLYEGYGAGGVAVLCEVLTDNRNRTAPEIRKIFELSHGKLGNTGCVAWMFETKGLFMPPAAKIDEEKLLEIALEAGADDVKRDGDNFAVTCDPAIHREVGKALAAAGIEPEAAEIARLPKSGRSTWTPTRQEGAEAHGAAGQTRQRAERGLEFQHPRRGDGGNRRGVSIAGVDFEGLASWFRITPDPRCRRCIVGGGGFLLLSERFEWFAFGRHKGWTAC